MTTPLLPVSTKFQLGKEVTEEQCRFLAHYGFLHFQGVASPDEVDRIATELDHVEAGWLAEGRQFVNGTPVFLGRDWEGQPYVQRFAFASCFSAWLHDFFGGERFEPVRRLVGEDARVGQDEKDGVVVNRFFNGPGSVHRRLGWHTDGLRDVFAFRMPVPQLNVGLHLDEIGAEDGGLRLLPCTQDQGVFSLIFRKLYFLWHRPDPREFAVETSPGDLTVHDGRLWHRVAASHRRGRASLRRAIYVPYLTGPYEPKHNGSRTPPYHHLGRLFRFLRRCLASASVVLATLAPVQGAETTLRGVPLEVGALEGTFALKLVTSDRVHLPVVGARPSGGVNYALVVRRYDAPGQRYRQVSQVCRVLNRDVAGTRLLIPDSTTGRVPPSLGEIVRVEPADGSYHMEGHHQLWGIRPSEAPFPDSAEKARSDPRLYDMDQDGNPGMTMRSDGLVNGDIYAIQTKRVALAGVVLGPDRIVGTSQVQKKSWVLGASNRLLRHDGPARTPDPDALANWFEEIRLPRGSNCSTVLHGAEHGLFSESRPF